MEETGAPTRALNPTLIWFMHVYLSYIRFFFFLCWGTFLNLRLCQLSVWSPSQVFCPWGLRLFHQWVFFSSLTARARSKMTMPGFIRLRLWKSGSGSVRQHFHTWFGHHRGQTFTPLRVFGMCWTRLRGGPILPSSTQDLGGINVHHWVEINLVPLQKLFEMPQQIGAVMLKLRMVQWKIIICNIFGQAVYILKVIA